MWVKCDAECTSYTARSPLLEYYAKQESEDSVSHTSPHTGSRLIKRKVSGGGGETNRVFIPVSNPTLQTRPDGGHY